MKLAFSALFLAALSSLALAVQPQKQVVVSYPHDTPTAVLDEAKAAIIKAGGIITHEYHLIKGFAANAPAKVLETVQALGTQNNVVIEEDQLVSANGS